GVTGNGHTFTGAYSRLTGSRLDSMRVGPGMAPRARLYPLKVFGCEGSTDMVIPALDKALDPNGDGDFSDHLDIVNLSLGADYAPVDDPENDVVDALAKQGVLSVIAMGNNGDLTDTGGTPGNATSSLAVASSVDALQQRDGLKVNSPAGVAGITAGQMSVAYDWPNRPPVTGAVAAIPGPNADGCAALTAEDAAKVAGKVAWLEWDDNDATRRCGSVGRSANVKAAGAIGAIFTSALDVFGAGITGDADIPVFQLPRAGTQKLRPAAEAGTLNVTFDGALQATIKDVTPGIVDTLSSFSSRGPHGSLGVVKPDVTAVGDTVSSANMGTGNQVLSESGTSMATPVTAGVAALVKAAHPGWTPLALKAAVMNSAVHDVYTGNDRSGRKYAPARVGAGRIDARRATTTSVLAYVRGANNPVSASFGVVPAPIAGGTVTRTKTLAVRNVKGSAVKVNLSYRATNTMPGVSYTVSPSTLSIPRNGTATATVTLKVVPQQLRKPIDPTMAATQVNPFFGEQEARQYVADASGRLLVTPTGGTAYRVPVYSAPKPTSSTTAALRDGAIELSGNGIPAGAGATFQSLATVMELGTTSPRLPACGAAAGPCASLATDKGADIQHVGAGQSGDLMWFGVSTYGDWANLGTVTIPYVDYDTTGDGTPDFETYVQNIDGTDLLYAWTVRLATDTLVDLEPVNFQLGDVDTNVFDNNVVTMPVFKEAVDLPTDGTTSAPITYSVGTHSGVYGRDVDHTDDVEYDAGTPAVATDQELYLDADGTSIELAGTGGDGVSALVFHLQGAAGHRAEVLPLPATPPVG
ncbi:MAG: S8 family serine peptidase, partial [Ornithinibacter sp.]